jgi:hypothetical protein
MEVDSFKYRHRLYLTAQDETRPRDGLRRRRVNSGASVGGGMVGGSGPGWVRRPVEAQCENPHTLLDETSALEPVRFSGRRLSDVVEFTRSRLLPRCAVCNGILPKWVAIIHKDMCVNCAIQASIQVLRNKPREVKVPNSARIVSPYVILSVRIHTKSTRRASAAARRSAAAVSGS